MVAKSGPGWRLAPSLVALVDEIDRGWPKRDRRSDGSIGDARHRAVRSDHNPDASGDVLALDLTEDHVNGPNLMVVWHHLVARRDPRVKYLIYEGRIVSSYPVGTAPAWVDRPYAGINAHRLHLHVSVLDTPAAKGDTSRWYPFVDTGTGGAGWPPLRIADRPYPGVVRMGDRGPDVAVWQQALGERGYQLAVDGVFGAATNHVVRHFQARAGLTADGIAGPATWHAVLFV